jgi:hypothetical protein
MRLPSRPAALLVAAAVLSLSGAAAPVAVAQSDPSDPSEAIQEAWDKARTMPDAFGGLWLDGGTVVFAFTEAATDEQVADVLALVPSEVGLAMVRVDHSEAALRATKDAITDAASAGELPFVTGVGVALRTNAVDVNVLPQYLLSCQAGLLERFGQVRLMFTENAGDVGATTPPASAPLPVGCLASGAQAPSGSETPS